jgi:hypothetical protein
MIPGLSRCREFHACAKNHMPLLWSLIGRGWRFYIHGAPNGAWGWPAAHWWRVGDIINRKLPNLGKIKNQKSKIKNQKSKIKNQK